jgi:hypothetical protein
MRLALKVLILAVLLAPTTAAAQGTPPPSLLTGTWVARGEGDCEGGGSQYSLSTDTPDPKLCRPGSNGRVALCFDKNTAPKAIGFPEPTCIYRRATPAECTGSGPRGKIYECQAIMTPEVLAQEVCRNSMSAPWAAAPGYTLTLVVDGATCEEAVGFLIVRRPNRLPIWASPPMSVAGSLEFQSVQTRADLESEMDKVVRLTHTILHTAGDLPEWPHGTADGRWSRGAVNWYVGEGITPAQWQEWRRTKAPLLALGLGMETYFVYVLDADGRIREIAFFVQG